MKIFPKWTVNSIFILLGIVLITVFVLLLKYIFTRDYTQKDNLLRQKKETWVRHVEAIGNYQKEMLGYIWEMNEYAGKTDDEKDTLLMDQIMKAWMKDNQKFISNMSAKK